MALTCIHLGTGGMLRVYVMRSRINLALWDYEVHDCMYAWVGDLLRGRWHGGRSRTLPAHTAG